MCPGYVQSPVNKKEMKSTLKVQNPRAIIILLLICINDVQGKEFLSV